MLLQKGYNADWFSRQVEGRRLVGTVGNVGVPVSVYDRREETELEFKKGKALKRRADISDGTGSSVLIGTKMYRRHFVITSAYWPMSKIWEDRLREQAKKDGKVDYSLLNSLYLDYAKEYSLVAWDNLVNWKITRKEKRQMLVYDNELVRAGFATVMRPKLYITEYMNMCLFICRICGKNMGSHSDSLYHEESHGISKDIIAGYRMSVSPEFFAQFSVSYNKWCVSRQKRMPAVGVKRKRRRNISK